MPPDFNEELYETTRLQGFTDTQLIERLNTITSQLENLQSKNDQDEALLISYEQDIDAKQTNIQAKKDILSGTEYQLESLRTMAIDKLNAHQALPHTASVESIREFVTHQISLLQVMQNDLNAVSEASEEQAKFMKEIQIMEDEISVREKMITELLETRELDGVTHVTLAKEKTILMKDKDRRKEKLLSTLALFD